MGLLGDPDGVHALAVVYRAKAAALAALGASFAQQAATARWECNKANRFRARAQDMRRDCEHRAGELMDISADLLRLEARIREQMRALEGLERRVRAFMDSAPRFGLDGLPLPMPWDALPWKPFSLPARHSLDWERVVRDLRNAGAAL